MRFSTGFDSGKDIDCVARDVMKFLHIGFSVAAIPVSMRVLRWHGIFARESCRGQPHAWRMRMACLPEDVVACNERVDGVKKRAGIARRPLLDGDKNAFA